MKQLILFGALVAKLWLVSLAQPVMTNGVIARMDFDGDGSEDLDYLVGADQIDSFPEDWLTGYAVEPHGFSRVVVATAQRPNFTEGEAVDASRLNYGPRPAPNNKAYNLPLLNYRARSYDGGQTWLYTNRGPYFEKEVTVLVGLRLAFDTGTHYGWIRLSRLVVDPYTPFELAGYAYHPVPGEAIGAGEPPPPPPLQMSVLENGSLNLVWNSAWGAVVLEWTESLDRPNWQPVPDASAPPVVLLPDEGQRFYRLRRP